MLSQKRRKKRQLHGLRTVELQRSKQGYGFTISGQQPCVLGNIIAGSPADLQGLKDGDHLVTVNGLAVSQLSHEKVVRVIGSCSGTLKVQIAEIGRTQAQYNDSDSSDEQYVKPRYSQRPRARSNSKTTHLPLEQLSQRKGTLHSHHLHNASKSTSLSVQPNPDPFPTIYNPVRPINGRSSDFGVVRQRLPLGSRLADSYSRGEGLPGYIASRSGGGQIVRSSSVPDVSAIDSQAMDLSKMLYPAMQPVVLSSSSTINADDDQPSLRVVVGYIGSIEMPQDSNLPTSRLQSIRSAVRRLRVEQKVHTLVLLEIRADGIKLINAMGAVIVHYPVSRLAMSGMYPDDKRFFGLVTVQEEEHLEGHVEDQAGTEISSSCHVFMVDPDFSRHNIHSPKAKMFGIHCTIDPNTHRCLEFPKSCSPILRTVAKLYRDKYGGIFNVPRRQERPATSDSDTNSDSGLGFHKDQEEPEAGADRVYVVDIHIPDNNSDSSASNSCERVPSPPPPVSSRTAASFSDTSVVSRSLITSYVPSLSASSPTRALNKQGSSVEPNRKLPSQNIIQSQEMPSSSKTDSLGQHSAWNAASVTKPNSSLYAALQDSKAISATAVSSTAMDPRTVEQLRSNMQRLLAMRKENIRDTQSLSDTESVISDVRSRGSSGSRVSFNPRVAIATHNYPSALGAVGGRSSGSDSSSYRSSKPRITTQNSLHSGMLPPSRKQRVFSSALKAKPVPPPVAPKPAVKMQRVLNDFHHQEFHMTHQHQEAVYKKQQEEHTKTEAAVRSLTLDGRQSRVNPNNLMASRGASTLSSKLSPRAYPSAVPRSTKVVAGERSAFQRISDESVTIPPPLNFYASRNYNDNNNNNNNSGASNSQPASESHQDYGISSNRTAGAAAAAAAANPARRTSRPIPARPVPAPRRISRAPYQETATPQVRSCSVPPPMSSQLQIGRELNVDDGLSIRSTSIQSLESERVQANTNSPQGVVLLDRSLSTESLVEVGTRNVDRGCHGTMGKQPLNNNDVGRVASWAVSFENLLQDVDGVEAFKKYLTLEYSEENIDFWLACEHFKTITDPVQLGREARRMYEDFIDGTKCMLTATVNIDSRATNLAKGHLDHPTSDMFDEAQSQIFRLMKTDSYTRFIKSEFYQAYLVKEFEKDKEKAGPSPVSSESSDTQKRRLFPNIFKDISRTFTNKVQSDNVNSARKSGSHSSDDSSLERVRPSAKSNRYDSSLTADLRDMKHRMDRASPSDVDSERLLRVVLPDGSTSVLQRNQSESLHSILAAILIKKTDLAVNSIDVFPLQSDRALDVSLKLKDIPYQELRVEKRCMVKLVLPNCKVIGIKAKPQRTIGDVVKPVLHKYDLNIDHATISNNGQPVSYDQPVVSVDNIKLAVATKEQMRDWGMSKKAPNAHIGVDDLIDFEVIFSRDANVEDSLSKRSKGSQLLGMLKNYSLDDSKSTLRKSKSKNVTFGPTKSLDDRHLAKATTNEKFLEMLSKIQSSRLNDQRGLSIDVGDIPDFLKSANDEGSMSPLQPRSHKDVARQPGSTDNSVCCSEETSNVVTSSSPGVGYRLSQHSQKSQHNASVITRTQLNNSYHRAIAAGEDDSEFDLLPQSLNNVNCTALPGNRIVNDTEHSLSSSLPNVPPPPEFGNEAVASTPICAVIPPSYQEAISRSNLTFRFNSNNNNNNNSNHYMPFDGTLHETAVNINKTNFDSAHQPMIYHDEADQSEDSDRSTPSPTTHSLVLTTEDSQAAARDSTLTKYDFYERQYNNTQLVRPTPPNDPVKVTFV